MTAPTPAVASAQDIAAIPRLDRGSHPSLTEGACLMEAVSYIAGEPWSDHPDCVCPVIGAFLRTWNDGLPDDERDDLLRPLISLVIGTRGTADVERRRSLMAADWLVRENAPAWLRLAGMTAQADALAALPEIIDMAQCPSLMPTLEAVRKDAHAAGAAAWDAARDGAAAWAAARAGDAAGAAAWAAARDVARDVARAAAGAVAGAAAWDALNPTRVALQQSALALVHRMIALTARVPA